MTDQYVKLNFLEGKKPEYYYEVREHVTTFGEDAGKNESFTNSEIFNTGDLVERKQKAHEYYQERLKGFEGGKYFLPFASPKDFTLGENAAFSIDCFLVEDYGYVEGYGEHMISHYPTEWSTFDKEEVQETKELEDHLFYNRT